MFKVKNTRRNIRRSVSPPSATATATATGTAQAQAQAQAQAPTQTPDTDVPEAARRRTGMLTFFDADAATSLQRPWLRLDRGQRLQRLRQFASDYPGLTDAEAEALYKVLVKANDAKALNTKQQIQYEEGKIVSIRGLRMTRVGDGAATFRIDVVRATKKRSREAEGAEKIEES